MKYLRSRHLGATFYILRYVAGASELGIFTRPTLSFKILDFCDSNCASYADIKCSINGFISSLGDRPVSWLSMKQPMLDLCRILSAEITWIVCVLHYLSDPPISFIPFHFDDKL